jgi:hypothetical protein
MYLNERKHEETGRIIQPAGQAAAPCRLVMPRPVKPLGKYVQCIAKRFFTRSGGFGMNELLGIAAALIIAAFIVIPGLKGLAESLIKKLTDWWEIITDQIFTTSP